VKRTKRSTGASAVKREKPGAEASVVNRAKPSVGASVWRADWWAEAGPEATPLRREEIVRAALALVDDSGFDALTMRRLAERIGIKAASLYNHVRDKHELLAMLADAVCAEIPLPEPTKAWRMQLETLARDCRRVLIAHRDSARALAATPPVGLHRLRLIEGVLAALGRAGLSDRAVADAGFVFNSYVVGFVLDETQGAAGDAAALGEAREQIRAGFKSLPAERYPHLVALTDELVDGTPSERFERGLKWLLDGIEGDVRRAAKKPARADGRSKRAR
jgi:TetR/AcrR family tetracycline transcriptional repressor